jgi:hypothetical protein
VKRFLILGFGRMGITHLAHINGLYSGNCSFEIYDPSAVFRLLSYFKLRKNISFLRAIPQHSDKYDGVIITSPPNYHYQNFMETLKLSNNFFIEKPLSFDSMNLSEIDQDISIYCGYVLRNNPCIEYLRSVIKNNDNFDISVDVKSNLGADVVDDWRYDIKKGGGCINELGSHAVNLALCFTRDLDLKDPLHLVNELTVGEFDIQLNSTNKVLIKGDWNTDVRKTMYSLKVSGENTLLETDLQSVKGIYNGEEVDWSPRMSPCSVGFYIRGIDFAMQTSKWLKGSFTNEDLKHAHITDQLLKGVIKHG